MSEAIALPNGTKRRPDLPSLTSLRAIAALTVFVYHLFLFGLAPFRGLAVLYSGVSFFFVLSGFILTWSHVSTQTARAFYLRRFARVYPSHFVVWMLLLITPLAPTVTTPVRAISSGLLIQTWSADGSVTYGMNGVTWSLGCEAFFYALFPFVIPLVNKWPRQAALAWAGGLFLVASAFVLIASTMQGPLGTIALSNPLVRLPEFVLGIVAARYFIEGYRLRSWQILVPLLVAVCGLALFDRKPAADVWGTVAALIVILSAAGRDLTGGWPWLRRPALIYFGRISFAIYLVHEIVIVNAVRILGIGPLAAFISLFVSTCLAMALHHAVEIPANRLVLRFARCRSGLQA